MHGDYLKQAIRYAAECGAPVVNTDEGIKAAWTTEEEDHVLMRYTLYEAAQVAEPRGIKIGLECHAQYSRTPDGLDRIYNLVKSPAIGINLDTGNAYLAGQDPYAWLERVCDRLVHLHAKDITVEHSQAERGKVAGTPVGCACGDGVIDWKRVIEIVRRCPRDIVHVGRVRLDRRGRPERETSESFATLSLRVRCTVPRVIVPCRTPE